MKNILNFKCPVCGVGIYNATKYPDKCSVCGHSELIVITPLKIKEDSKDAS